MIRFHCPHCGKAMTDKDEIAGKRGKCPRCGRVVAVPLASELPVSPPGTEPDPQLASSARHPHLMAVGGGLIAGLLLISIAAGVIYLQPAPTPARVPASTPNSVGITSTDPSTAGPPASQKPEEAGPSNIADDDANPKPQEESGRRESTGNPVGEQ